MDNSFFTTFANESWIHIYFLQPIQIWCKYNKIILMEQIKLVKSTDVTQTLLAIPVKASVLCPNKTIASSVVRSTVSRLKAQGKGDYVVEVHGDGVLITRKW